MPGGKYIDFAVFGIVDIGLPLGPNEMLSTPTALLRVQPI